jgi:release factor glutamine methyltransferase
MGLNFKINHDVLIPRQETEILVEAVLDEIQRRKSRNLNILDVGTGSGAIAISLAHYCPKCLIIANDNSRKALATAKKNAGSLNTKNVDFILCEATELPGYISEKSDIIVSNPPYVSENHYPALHPQVKNYEPAGALKAGKEGMDFYRSFIPIISLLLKPGGMIFMEIGFDQREKIHFLLKEFRFSHIEFIQDYQKTDRIVKAKL